ncbi:hypothetical protein M422DRAFT_271094 [Sphaerobolus stellatus SS14]|uniref:Uncharacterized protein n=1 Tax=Sphaerobolus stellatus (strain SS14) TaxID=990650 RepID=A0A0C9UFD9_SPHS4|nr:hypothetical protein M422DRAFT_271094 [Sphaerobolus stellatus SS14]
MAVLLKADALGQSSLALPSIPIPNSASEAHTLHAQTIVAYLSVTTPPLDPMDLSPIAKIAAIITDILNKSPEALFDANETEPTPDEEEETAISDSESVAMDTGDEFDFIHFCQYSGHLADPLSMLRAWYIWDMNFGPESLEDYKFLYGSIMDLAVKLQHLIKINQPTSQLQPTMLMTTQLTNNPNPLPPPPSTSLKHPGSPLLSQRPTLIPISPKKSQ